MSSASASNHGSSEAVPLLQRTLSGLFDLASTIYNGLEQSKTPRVTLEPISAPSDARHIAGAVDEEQAEAILRAWQKNGSKLMNALDDLEELDAPTTNEAGTMIAWSPLSRPSLPLLDIDEHTKTKAGLPTLERAVATQIFLENFYQELLRRPRARDKRQKSLEREMHRQEIEQEKRVEIRNAFWASESAYLRDKRTRIDARAFEAIKVIGRGAYGVVRLVREKESRKVYAMKQIRKSEMLLRGQEGHVRAERDFLMSASQSTHWIVRLAYTFQDAESLFLVMDYEGGGDLLTLLIAHETLPEEFARFYLAEMICAVEECHALGYVHRDLKPDNFLVTNNGHLRLSDFGLATDLHSIHSGKYYEDCRKRMMRKHGHDVAESIRSAARSRRLPREDEPGSVLTKRDRMRRRFARSNVGTSNYIAPEVLLGQPYDMSVDWWAVGVILFEMLYGFPPFNSRTRGMTRYRILNHRQMLHFPPSKPVSAEAIDLIRSLLCDREDRLRSASAIKKHSWFDETDLASLHQQNAPFQPELRSEIDTRHFDELDEDVEPLAPAVGADNIRDPILRGDTGKQVLELRKQTAFAGYTFKRIRHGVFDEQWRYEARKDAMPTKSSLLRSMSA